MTPYVIYDPETGEIAQSGQCNSEEDMVATVGDRTYLVGWGEQRTHYVQGGTIYLYTPEQRKAKDMPQIMPCRWNNATMAYERIALG